MRTWWGDSWLIEAVNCRSETLVARLCGVTEHVLDLFGNNHRVGFALLGCSDCGILSECLQFVSIDVVSGLQAKADVTFYASL